MTTTDIAIVNPDIMAAQMAIVRVPDRGRSAGVRGRETALPDRQLPRPVGRGPDQE